MIDFGPYPLHKDWLIKSRTHSDQALRMKEDFGTGFNESKNVFLPPDLDTDPSLGIKSLVIEYKKDGLALSQQDHIESKFCKTFRLEEPLNELVLKLNEQTAKFKNGQNNAECRSFLMLTVGLLFTGLVCMVLLKNYMQTAAIVVICSYLFLLALFLYKNSKKS